MARGGRYGFNIQATEVLKMLEVAVSRVERGTKKATIAACEEIKAMTLEEVPKETGTLESAFGYRVEGHRRNFTAALGYGIIQDPKNPNTGQNASDYMVAAHEDLDAVHSKGKAKFLEDPVRAYQGRFLPGMGSKIRSELNGG